ncbi:MAG TPA: hypothetical protein PL117_13110 [Accumulibacter sp.]|uniref:hypothetical protein n=1 Tax=Accumulibacter sp. TaxID=2053492 RepID=UPI002B5C5646|nr:hypothetical protein [Accumulibacter sp.]HRF73706.1 hypothetical protein [Accumulibacter sp.]
MRKFHVYFKHRLAVRAIVERFVELPKYGGAYLLMIEAGRRDSCNRLAVNRLPIISPAAGGREQTIANACRSTTASGQPEFRLMTNRGPMRCA